MHQICIGCTQPTMGHHGPFLTTDYDVWFLELWLVALLGADMTELLLPRPPSTRDADAGAGARVNPATASPHGLYGPIDHKTVVPLVAVKEIITINTQNQIIPSRNSIKSRGLS